MLQLLRQWIRGLGEWHRVHRRVWPQQLISGSDGFTPFQHLAKAELCAAIDPVVLEPTFDNTFGHVLCGKLSGTEAVITIYAGEVEIAAGSECKFWAEHQGYKTPQDLVQALVFAATELQSNNSFKPKPLRGSA